MYSVLDPIESELSSPEFSCGWKCSESQQAIFWELCKQNSDSPSKELLLSKKAREHRIEITPRHANRLRRKWGLNRHRGRPSTKGCVLPEKQQGEVIKFTPNLPNVGLQLFHLWMEQWSTFGELTKALEEAVERHKKENPEDSFALLFHRPETLLRRFQALFYAPLQGIERLTEYDVKEHSLSHLLGRSYQSSTLNQFVGQLERIDATESLMPLLSWGEKDDCAYIDGHMIALWTHHKMHKGKMTMLGRVMAGSQAVITHDSQGYVLYFEYHPPDHRLPTLILDYCQKVVTEHSIEIFVIDREVNSLKIAQKFEAKGWGLLSMLNKNEYQGLESFHVTEIETVGAQKERIYKGKWKKQKKEEEDPRHFVLVEQEEKVLVYWGTSRVAELLEKERWPEVYRLRNEVQENGFKGMIAHGALNINYGFKKIWGPDRHQQRAKQKVEDKLQKTEKKRQQKALEVGEQKAKVQESQQKSHEKRLEQRQEKLVQLQREESEIEAKKKELEAQISDFGEPKERADRDFRKQKVMTFRTLLLENYLRAFVDLLLGATGLTLSVETVLHLLFKRSGGCIQTRESFTFWVNQEGLSESYRKIVESLITGLNQMKLTYQGKAVTIRSRDGPIRL